MDEDDARDGVRRGPSARVEAALVRLDPFGVRRLGRHRIVHRLGLHRAGVGSWVQSAIDHQHATALRAVPAAHDIEQSRTADTGRRSGESTWADRTPTSDAPAAGARGRAEADRSVPGAGAASCARGRTDDKARATSSRARARGGRAVCSNSFAVDLRSCTRRWTSEGRRTARIRLRGHRPGSAARSDVDEL